MLLRHEGAHYQKSPGRGSRGQVLPHSSLPLLTGHETTSKWWAFVHIISCFAQLESIKIEPTLYWGVRSYMSQHMDRARYRVWLPLHAQENLAIACARTLTFLHDHLFNVPLLSLPHKAQMELIFKKLHWVSKPDPTPCVCLEPQRCLILQGLTHCREAWLDPEGMGQGTGAGKWLLHQSNIANPSLGCQVQLKGEPYKRTIAMGCLDKHCF